MHIISLVRLLSAVIQTSFYLFKVNGHDYWDLNSHDGKKDQLKRSMNVHQAPPQKNDFWAPDRDQIRNLLMSGERF